MGIRIEHSTPVAKESGSSRIEELLKQDIKLFGNKVNSKKKEAFYAQLATLLEAGIQLREGFVIMEQNAKPKDKTTFQNLIQQLDTGYSLAEAFEKGGNFGSYERLAIEIGEKTGFLPRVTQQLADYYQKRNERKRQIIGALTYPLIILCTAVLVVVFMLRMVVPMFEDIFRQNGVDLPWITQVIVGLSELLQTYGGLLVLVLIGLFFAIRMALKRPEILKVWQKGLLRVPVLGPFIRLVHISKFTQTLSLLTTSKIPFLTAIQMIKDTTDFLPLQTALTQMETTITAGGGLYKGILASNFFDQKMISMVKVAEETNKTEYVFEKLNSQYNTDIQQKSKMLSTLLEPLIIIFVGLFVGVILISMYLPMFKLSSVLG